MHAVVYAPHAWELVMPQEHLEAHMAQMRAFVTTHHWLPVRRSPDSEEHAPADWAYRHARARRPSLEVIELIDDSSGRRPVQYDTTTTA